MEEKIYKELTLEKVPEVLDSMSPEWKERMERWGKYLRDHKEELEELEANTMHYKNQRIVTLPNEGTSPYKGDKASRKEYDEWYKAQFTDEEILKEIKPPFRIDKENVLEFDTIIVPNE